jgi:predicted amidohydrolase
MTKLTVSLAQIKVERSKPDVNLAKGEDMIAEAANRGSDIICFPEMWTTGFDWTENKRIAGQQSATIKRIAEMARHYNIWINGSLLALNEAGKVANTSILFDSGGNIAGIYRKTHLFSFIHEERHMAEGEALCTVDTPWGRAGLAICYDLRFPELFRTYALRGVRMQFLPAAFPHPRLPHWQVLLRARAIENQVFLLAVNQVGTENLIKGRGTTYFGNSAVIGPWGETLIEGSETDEELLTASIDLDEVDRTREKNACSAGPAARSLRS